MSSPGSLRVLGRVVPGKRPLYVVEDASGRVQRVQGNVLVRMARNARRDGIPVEMANGEPWRDEVTR